MFYLVSLVKNDGEVSRFDPYTILGIEHGSSDRDIKKAYRKMSLKYHPDKNLGDAVAQDMFVKVSKAYESLTDADARDNYEKYGNPDGKQALEVSIGLPKILLDNPKVVLVFYLIAMVVLIPLLVGLWYANSKQYGEKNILYETYTAFYQILTENHRLKMLPEVMAVSAEYRKINTPKDENSEWVSKFYGKMKGEKLMHKPKFEHMNILTGNLLLHAHLMRLTGNLTQSLQKDLEKMLNIAPDLLEGMIEVSFQRRWLQTTVSAIKLSQCIIQGLWHSDHSLLQLPHFTEAEVKHVAKGAKVQAKTLSEYLRVEDAEKKGLAKLTEEEKQDVFKACKLLPRIKVDLKLFVEEENESESVHEDDEPSTEVAKTEGAAVAVSGDVIYEQDLVTLRVTITRENLEDGETAPPVHAPLFPRPMRESWWVMLVDQPKVLAKDRDAAPPQGNIHAVEKITDQSKVVVHDLRFMAPPKAGDYSMDLYLYSDCYMGLDEELEVKFSVQPAKDLPEYVAHPEDLELDNEPTLFEQVMTAAVDDSSDEEEEDKEEEEELTDAQKRRREQRKAKLGKAEESAPVEETNNGSGRNDVEDEDADEEDS